MLKMYSGGSRHGGAASFWEECTVGITLEEALRFCELDPLRPLHEKYVGPGVSMLEGGCGVGAYVAFHAARGVKVVGLDFSERLLAQLHARDRRVKLAVGDVAALPFRAESFDVYYSGGVVEHFERGPEEALHEAHRVLRPGGILLISVPYFSPLRHLLRFFRNDWMRLGRPTVAGSANDRDRQFFQYAFTRDEFRQLLVHAGFRVLATRGYAIVWGLYDLGVLRHALGAMTQRRQALKSAGCSATSRGRVGDRHLTSLLKRLVVSEDDRIPVLGLGVRALRWGCANMMLYVCTAEEVLESRAPIKRQRSASASSRESSRL